MSLDSFVSPRGRPSCSLQKSNRGLIRSESRMRDTCTRIGNVASWSWDVSFRAEQVRSPRPQRPIQTSCLQWNRSSAPSASHSDTRRRVWRSVFDSAEAVWFPNICSIILRQMCWSEWKQRRAAAAMGTLLCRWDGGSISDCYRDCPKTTHASPGTLRSWHLLCLHRSWSPQTHAHNITFLPPDASKNVVFVSSCVCWFGALRAAQITWCPRMFYPNKREQMENGMAPPGPFLQSDADRRSGIISRVSGRLGSTWPGPARLLFGFNWKKLSGLGSMERGCIWMNGEFTFAVWRSAETPLRSIFRSLWKRSVYWTWRVSEVGGSGAQADVLEQVGDPVFTWTSLFFWCQKTKEAPIKNMLLLSKVLFISVGNVHKLSSKLRAKDASTIQSGKTLTDATCDQETSTNTFQTSGGVWSLRTAELQE